MRPSQIKGNIGVLDTRAECLVVKDALRDKDFIERNRATATFEMRFYDETHDTDYGYGQIDIDRTKLVTEPRFEVRDTDHTFVLRAAAKAASEKKLLKRLRNKLTGRTKAANSMINFLARDTFYERLDSKPELVRHKKSRDTVSDNDAFCSESRYVIDGEEIVVATRTAEITTPDSGYVGFQDVLCTGNGYKGHCGLETCARVQVVKRKENINTQRDQIPKQPNTIDHQARVIRVLKHLEKGGKRGGKQDGEPVRVRNRSTF